MANNEKINERLKVEEEKINNLVVTRDQLFIDRDNITSFGEKKRETIRLINEQIKSLNQQLREMGQELTEEKTKLEDEFCKVTKIKGKKIHINYELNGEKLSAHIAANSKGKFYNVVSELNLNNTLLAYFNETVTIKEDGIVSQFKIDEDAVAKMSLEERLAYFNELCAKMSNSDAVKEPAKRVTLGKRYCIISECDLDVYINCLNRYRDALIESAKQTGDKMRLQATQILAKQDIKVEDVELSSFHIDWDLVNSLRTFEEKADYFNNLAKKIASAPKTETTKVALGANSCAIVNKCDEMIFLQCFDEYSKAKRAILASLKPSYTIDWDFVNSLESAEKRAEYFENLCGKIDAVEKFETTTVSYRNRSFIINKVDADVFNQAIAEFEKNYLQAVREKRQAELVRIEEEKKQEEARKEAERLKKEEEARVEEEKRQERERIEKAIAESKRLDEEKKQAQALAEAREKEQMKKMEELAKASDEAKQSQLVPNTEEIVAATLDAINSGAETRIHIEQRDDDVDECIFINKGNVVGAEGALETLEAYTPGEEDDEIDFFDSDEDFEETVERNNEPKDNNEQAIQEDVHAIAKELGGTVSIINGIEILDLSPDEKKQVPEEDKNSSKEKDDSKKHPFRDFFKGKKGKKKEKAKKITPYTVGEKADVIDIDLEDDDVFKVLNTRGYIGNISESKLYTTKKELYLFIMDWIADQKITNKVVISTKRHTVEIDAKYEDIYTFIANRYEKLEDKYELIATDKYHNLKVKFACGSAIVVCGAFLLLTAGRGLFADNTSKNDVNVVPDQINYEVENDLEGSLIDTSEYDSLSKINAMINGEENLQSQDEEENNVEILEDQDSTPSTSSRDTNLYDTTDYNYPGMEAFNMDTSELGIKEEDATEEIKREAETNGTPLLQLIR